MTTKCVPPEPAQRSVGAGGRSSRNRNCRGAVLRVGRAEGVVGGEDGGGGGRAREGLGLSAGGRGQGLPAAKVRETAASVERRAGLVGSVGVKVDIGAGRCSSREFADMYP